MTTSKPKTKNPAPVKSTTGRVMGYPLAAITLPRGWAWADGIGPRAGYVTLPCAVATVVANLPARDPGYSAREVYEVLCGAKIFPPLTSSAPLNTVGTVLSGLAKRGIIVQTGPGCYGPLPKTKSKTK